MALVIHSFMQALLWPAQVQCAECSAIRGRIGTEKQRERGSPRQREGEGGGQSFSIFRRAQSGLVVRSTNIGNGAVYCVGDKEGEGGREGGGAFAK